MKIRLSDHFTFGKILKFTYPAVVMMVFSSIYTVVDGYFVSNYAGKEAFTALNFIVPYPLILGSIGLMFGSGGGALIAKTLGEKRPGEANEIFSLIVYSSMVCAVILQIVGLVTVRPLAVALGATGRLLEDSVVYGSIFIFGVPLMVLQYEFQCFFATAEKPKLGLYVTVASGLANIVLDFLLVGVLRWGLVGAATATVLSQLVGGVPPLVYFLRPNRSLLRLGRTRFRSFALLRACTNGASELLTNVSVSLVSMLYNIQLLHYAGEDGVAAFGVLMYVCFFFQAAFIGYGMGIAPVISYHYGAGNHSELRSLLRKSLLLVGLGSLVMFSAGELFSTPFTDFFVGYDLQLQQMTRRSFVIFSISYLFCGFNMFCSYFFTALNNGLVSGLISFLRTLVFQVAAVLILPLFWELDGIWFSVVAAELASLGVSGACLLIKRKQYHY